MVRSIDTGHGCPASPDQTSRTCSKHPLAITALLLFRALPDHAGKTLQRHQRLAGPGPLLQLLDRDVIERLPAGAARKQRARDVDHVRRTRALVKQRRAAARTKMARGPGRLVLVARDSRLAFCDAETLAPASDVSGIGRAVGAARGRRMIMPGPARRHVDLERNRAAQALALRRLARRNGFWLLRGLRVLREHRKFL